MSASQIIAELPRLSSAELAQVQAKLLELVEPSREVGPPRRIRSPRLLRPEAAMDFVKQVLELAPDAKL